MADVWDRRHASPWPLSETYYLCVYDGNANSQYGAIDCSKRRYVATLLDALATIRQTDPQISSQSDAATRPRPPVLTHGTPEVRLPDGARLRWCG